jgi:hypothetical protein
MIANPGVIGWVLISERFKDTHKKRAFFIFLHCLKNKDESEGKPADRRN